MEQNNIINSLFSEENIEIEEDRESDDTEEDAIGNESFEEINNSLKIKYNPNDYIKQEIIDKLMKHKLLVDKMKCDKCDNFIHLNVCNGTKDGIIWRCSHLDLNKHENKCNIRVKSIFEKMKCYIRLLYFIIFNNFIERKSINQTYYNCREFIKQIKIETISKKSISKFMNIIRLKIMHNFHNKCIHNQIGTEPADNSKPRIELDESKIVTFDNQVK